MRGEKATEKCSQCGKEFEDYVSNKRSGFCSLPCYWEARKNNPKYGGYWTGKERKEETKRKISETKTGTPSGRKGIPGKLQNENHPSWKGEEVSYSGLHYWVSRKLGKPDTCEHCGKDGLKGKYIHWANKSREYKRDLEDWLRLCAKCHKKYDKSL